MSRRRNGWENMRRQSRVSASSNPAFMLNPSLISYGESDLEDSRMVTPTENTAYFALEKRITEALEISSVALRKRITDELGISPDMLEKIIAGDLCSSPATSNPWIKHLVKIDTDRVLKALLSKDELVRLNSIEGRKHRIEERKRNPDKWSPYGRLD
jgi:hypothetical protein